MTTFLPVQPSSETARQRALWMSTIAFTACFAVWTIFLMRHPHRTRVGPQRNEFVLAPACSANPHGLTGSVARPGIWTDRYGGRVVYTFTSEPRRRRRPSSWPMPQPMPRCCLRRLASVLLAAPCRRRGLCFPFLPGRAAGNGARHFAGQRGVRRSRTSSLLWFSRWGLAGCRSGVGRSPRRHGRRCFGSAPVTTEVLAAPKLRIERAFGWSLSAGTSYEPFAATMIEKSSLPENL